MIISKTPLRISLFGGGSDLPEHFNNSAGSVLSFTIDKYIYVIVNKRFEKDIRVSYTTTEIVEGASDLKHELVRECLRYLEIEDQIEVVTVADIPGGGSGLGSSSALVVGLLNALSQYAVKNHIPITNPIHDVAEVAYDIERNICHKPVGKQDHYAAAYGGLNRFSFFKDDGTVSRIPLDPGFRLALQSQFLLFWTGIARSSSPILVKQSNKTKAGENRKNLAKMAEQARKMEDALNHGEIQIIGKELDKAWRMKKSLAGDITNNYIEHWYNEALKAGAKGGKICGAGGGGFLLLFANPNKHDAIKKALPLQHVPFTIESKGTHICHG